MVDAHARSRVLARTTVAVLLSTLASSCGAIKVVPPDETVAPGQDVYINSCDLLTKAEVERALGSAVQPARVWVPASDEGTICNFTRGLNGDEVELSVWHQREEPKPIPDRSTGWQSHMFARSAPEPVDGVARYAAWSDLTANCCPGGELSAHTADGARFYVRIYDGDLSREELRRVGIELGRAAARRLRDRFPGRRSALPRPTAPPFDPCRLVSVDEQVRELGWSGGHEGHQPPSPPSASGLTASAWMQILRHREREDGWSDEYVGGAAGGSWMCVRSGGEGTIDRAEFALEIFKRRVSPTALSATPVRAIRELDRPAFVVGLPPAHTTPSEHLRWAAIFFGGGKGRVIGLYLRDMKLDAAAHQRHLVALAKLVASRVGK